MKDGNSKLQQILKTKKNKLKTVHRERENPPRNLKIKWKNRVGYGRNHEKNQLERKGRDLQGREHWVEGHSQQLGENRKQ